MKNKKETKTKNTSENKSNKLGEFYKKNYKKLMVIPAIMFFLSVLIIIHTISVDGTPIYRDISLKGGLSAIINTNTQITAEEYEDALHLKFQENSFIVSELFEDGKKVGFIIDTDLDENLFLEFNKNYFKTDFVFGENYTSNFISPTLSLSFFKQAMYILLFSFVGMSIVVWLYFRELVPSGAIILSGIFDLVVTVGILDLFGVKISIAGIGALLMLIGYSIDTDILLTQRVVKEFGYDYFDKMFFAFKTGLLMTVTTFVAAISTMMITNSPIIFEIALILAIGLIVDVVSTWIQNSGILLWWLEKRDHR